MKWKLLLLVAVTLIILHIPYIGIFLQAANTMLHESGHALAGILTKSTVYDIQLFASTEGITRVAFHSWWSGVITGLAGYWFASVTVWLLAWMWSKNRDKGVLYFLILLSALNLLFWVRNPYGVAWVTLFLLLLFILSRLLSAPLRRSSTFVILLIILIDSIRSALTVFLIAVLRPHAAGDATLLAEWTTVPAPIWGALFFGQALFFGWMAARRLWSARPDSRRHIPARLSGDMPR